MVEMDQFVHQLSGGNEEIVERSSTENSLTMKDAGMPIVE